ncbi:sulfotransferase family 2 domain-containing protein [Sulfitobacter aestuariivivens]|uniref:Sulfotransferase family 2 domain-containing protein n=1 Tax=Sulfitobacter aestuariivivens TaxID=2766981 RepID=A0A927DBH5_9RHOB|nr:sulfotransferase family 2 domain-containing protein [Sulfitobacter aestuariivivens]MBD3666226.1 sulfotransferase family 2 domain-containing protein [Sulfitobacter aestuariivivens]
MLRPDRYHKAEAMLKSYPSYRPVFGATEFRRRNMHYLLPNEEGKAFLYTYIRKNACTSFKMLMMDRVGAKAPRSLEKIRKFRTPVGFRDWDQALLVYRDPVDRAISAFTNKFIDGSGNVDIFRSFEALTGKDAASATFRDYLSYTRNPFSKLDPHTWPQKAHLMDGEYSIVVEMKEISKVMKAELPSVAGYFRKPLNSSNTGAESTEDLSDVPANQIAKYSKSSFEALRPEFEDVYAVDMEMIAQIKKNTPEG